MPPGNLLFLVLIAVVIPSFLGGIVYLSRRESRPKKRGPVLPIAKPPMDGSPKPFSKIDIYEFVRQKAVPQPPEHWPEQIEHMTVDWGEPEDNCTVELYLALSYDERAAIKRHGLNEKVLEEEDLFDDDDLERIERAQEKELRHISDPRIAAAYRAEHQSQLAQAKRETWGKTIEYYLTYPYTKTLPTPYQATLYRKKLEKKVLPEIRDMLKEYVG